MSSLVPTFNSSTQLTQVPNVSPTPAMLFILSDPSYKDSVKIILLMVFLALIFLVLVSLCLWVTLHTKSWPRQANVPPLEAAPEVIDIALTDEDKDDIAEV
nr:hypothetical protein CFP56_61869 [Quercus suber]POF24539.1 hypothetical protein CFP56_76349 [Quercus suber]